ncbi:protein MIS12 homolog [Hyposmocoma kahamanoa]|uniref:protein MIS12 homolog n=1 Tax=Hyposmocoma kahamanoa TaxID=1477025 RepID=UPI000E6D9E00|nr:protein MIS12 homolog [Hyposmocoma kahamanoa]
MIKTEPWTGGIDEEYETQYFGFGAQRLKIAVRQMVEQKIETGVKEMKSYLLESLELNDTDKLTLTHSCDKLLRLYCHRAGPSLHIIDEEIERILKVPSNVLLPEDEVQIQQSTDEDYVRLKEEVANLRRRVERAALMEALLTAEEDELTSVEEVCETAKKDMEVLDLLNKNIEGAEGLKTLQNDTQFLCTNVPFMNVQMKSSEDNFFDK